MEFKITDWWQEQGGDLAGMLVAYWRPPVEPPRSAEFICLSDISERDDSLRPALLALTERDDDPQVRALTAAARALSVERQAYGWWSVLFAGAPGHPRWSHHGLTEPAIRLALKRAVLALYDPLVRVPCRAEGARLTVRQDGREREMGPALLMLGKKQVYHSAGVYLDGARVGARVGAPPDWSWTPHALPCETCGVVAATPGVRFGGTAGCKACRGGGGRLLVTWECRPSSLLPAARADAGEGGELLWAHARAVHESGVVPLDLTHGPLTG